jgi:gentisate 1,2-dioxygenase
MAPGDLVLTPSWTWHDHNSAGDGPMVWFDGLDLPLIKYLDAVFFENFPGELLQSVEGEHNHSQRLYGTAGLRPADAEATGPSSPLLIYRWADTDAALDALRRERDEAMVSLQFVNPVSGAPVFPTLNSEMHRLVPGRRTATTRTTGSRVFVVYEGAGSTVIEGQRFDWRSGDMFVIPSWAAVDHEAEQPSDLFSIDDSPPLKALGLFRHGIVRDRPEVAAVFGG